jgi:ribonuclease HI
MMKSTKVMAGTSTTALEVLTGTPPLDLALSEVLCQEITRLQAQSTDFPLLKLVIQQSQNQEYLTSGVHSPLHTMLQTVNDLRLQLTSIESFPVTYHSLNNLKRPIVHEGPVFGKPKKDWSELEKIEASIHVLKEVLDVPDNCSIAFTDGSALGNPGPCGGAALVYIEGLDGPVLKIKTAGSKNSSSYYGELIGLRAALMTIALEAIILPKEAHCFIDCTSVIGCAAGTSDATGHYETVEDIHNLVDFLENRQCRVHLHWSPSHIGISLNEEVDTLAKEAAEIANSMTQEEMATCKWTIKQTKKAISQVVDARWQRRWSRDTCKTQTFIPQVKRQVKLRLPRQVEMARAGCISGHNRLADHMYKLKLKDSPNCPCGTDRQSPEHVVMNCPLHQTSRDQMIEKVEKAFIMNNVPLQYRTLTFRDLLVPNYDSATNSTVSAAMSDFFMSCSGVNF